MGTAGDKGQGTRDKATSPFITTAYHHGLRNSTTCMCVFTEHFVFKVSDNELHGLSKRTAFVAGTYRS